MYRSKRLFAKKDYKMITLANKRFKVIASSNVKDLGSNTILSFRQKGELLIGKYEGGKVLYGNFIAKLAEDNTFKRFFQHYNSKGSLINGKGSGKIETLNNGKVRLHEIWKSDLAIGNVIYEELETEPSAVDGYYYQLSINK